ncbi:YlzJ-like family protein [Petroclostridium xylanilyticum]|uniref:YlzJ-like family protein n=1 Tax=Petroclostridium xylanilyticum TaxID=1792311 RepID=UPI0012FF88BB|nr:YlzJ-like family protein [Petroclostridium xylanilyticum]
MIIHSIIPHEIIFAQQREEAVTTQYIIVKGELLEVTPLSSNQYRVNRIISTCLKPYLEPQFQPGAIIEYNI